MKRIVQGIVALVVLAYAGATAYLKVNETGLVFHPDERTVAEPGAKFALHQQPVRYTSTDGTTLSAWIVPAAPADSSLPRTSRGWRGHACRGFVVGSRGTVGS